MKPETTFLLLGAGYWARPQLAAWQEVEGAKCVGIYNRTKSKAEALAQEFGIKEVDDDPQRLLERVNADFVDIVTDVSTHAHITKLAAKHCQSIVCQKPMAQSLADAESMLSSCEAAGVQLYIHENWRWQKPMRALSNLIQSGAIGRPFRASIDMISGFPVFEEQPFLAEIEQFIIADLGSHTLDTARFLFGEAKTLSCLTGKANPNIKGEDHATLTMRMGPLDVSVVVRMAYAQNFVERECFPQTLFFVEGTEGSIEVCPNYEIRVTTKDGTRVETHPPIKYDWVDPRYAVVQSSIVDCHKNLLGGITGAAAAETTGQDNIKTVRLVYAAYDAANSLKTISLT